MDRGIHLKDILNLETKTLSTMYHDNKSHVENICQSVRRGEEKLMKVITHKNITDIQTYPGPQLFQCILQVMSCRVEIPETNTHHHTHTPTEKSVSFIAGNYSYS